MPVQFYFLHSIQKKVYDHAMIHCVRFTGKDKVNISDDKYFGGPLLNQYKQAIDWLKNRLEVSYIIEGTGPRVEKWEIPLAVFKEALMNAICHRDYIQDGAMTMVEIYDDRVEINNPGGLLPQVAKDFGHVSLSRNKLIFSLFTRMQLVEKVGSGISRMALAMEKAGLPDPYYKTDGFFRISFKRENVSVNEPVNEPLKLVLSVLKEHPDFSKERIADEIQKSRATVTRALAELTKNGVIRRVGSDKTGHWTLENCE